MMRSSSGVHMSPCLPCCSFPVSDAAVAHGVRHWTSIPAPGQAPPGRRAAVRAMRDASDRRSESSELTRTRPAPRRCCRRRSLCQRLRTASSVRSFGSISAILDHLCPNWLTPSSMMQSSTFVHAVFRCLRGMRGPELSSLMSSLCVETLSRDARVSISALVSSAKLPMFVNIGESGSSSTESAESISPSCACIGVEIRTACAGTSRGSTLNPFVQ
mmetsp:Transcript_33279/g.73094  ORF Transcript_33279/g.73094 Transcript_33279/m.73094 type:complete len:216 (+) Transcript_33279:846-1493(+)